MIKTFLQFINEQYKYEGLFRPHKNGFIHQADVGGHHVDVQFGRVAPGHFHVDYMVNGKFSKAKTHVNNQEHQLWVMKHVSDTVHHFIGEKKPLGLTFVPHDADAAMTMEKDKVYGAFAKQVAGKHGATYTRKYDGFGPVHTIEFPQHA